MYFNNSISRLMAVLVLAGNLAYTPPVWSQAALSDQAIVELLLRAKALVAAGSMQEAYDALSPHELQLAGNIDYDYLLGTAAVDSGQAGLAIFALVRAVERQPNFTGARMELARAYFELGNAEMARLHFEFLERQDPPELAKKAIARYLRALERMSGAYSTVHLPYISAGFGYDNNANASTGDDQFLFFTLDENNVETDSGFYSATLGDYYSRPLSADVKMVLSGSLGLRNYPDASFVNSTNANANAGLEWVLGDTRLAPSLLTTYNWLDGEKNLVRYGADLQALHTLSSTWKLVAGVGAVANRYEGALSVRDVNVLEARAGFEHSLDSATGTVVSLLALAGVDEANVNDSIYENDHWSVALNLNRAVAAGVLLTANARFKNTEYTGVEGFPGVDPLTGNIIGTGREDDEIRATVSLHLLEWPISGWRTIGMLGYSDVDSSVDLYTYDRMEVGLRFLHSFE